jgi:hypothetical protein
LTTYDKSRNRKNSQLSHIKTTPRKPEELAYFAGLFDGEGSIFIHKRLNSRNCPSWTLVVALSMGDEAGVLALHGTFGGHFNTYGIAQGHNKPRFVWRTQNDAAVEILKALYPYLKVKKQQAALAFKFREIIRQNFGQTDKHRLNLRDEIMEEMRRLNKPYLGSVETESAAPSGMKFQSELTGDSEKKVGNTLLN